MTNTDKNLSKLFGVPELASTEIQAPSMAEEETPEYPVAPAPEYPVAVSEDASEQIDADVDFVKHKLKSILANGENTFAALAEIAKAEERASHFEALNGMMGQMSSIAMGILDAEGKRQKLKAGLGDGGQPATVNNTQNNTTVYVGTTADLQKMLDEEDAQDEVIDVEAKPKD